MDIKLGIPPPLASCNQVFVDPVVLRRDCVSLRRWDPETDGSLEETSWAGAGKVGGTEHVEDEDERKATWACRGRVGGRMEGWERRRGSCWVVGGGRERESGGVWRGSGRWSGEQRSEAQERSLLFWLLSHCRRFCRSSARLARSARPPARLDAASRPRQRAAALLSAQTLLSLLLLTTILWFSSVFPPPLPPLPRLHLHSLQSGPGTQMWTT